MTINKPFISACIGEKPDKYPVWFMRQAGRYLPEYMEIRKELDFVTLCQTPKKAAEVTIQPLKRFDLDAAIIFSDILILPTAMGQDLSFAKNHGPILKPVIQSIKDLNQLKKIDAQQELGFVGESISATKKQLNPEQAMIGFAGAPFTVATYMVEGSGSKTYTNLKRFMYSEPSGFTELIDQIVTGTVDYLTMQVAAGADALMLFDTWATMITPQDYKHFIHSAMVRLVSELKAEIKKITDKKIPLIYFPGKGVELLYELDDLDFDVISIHWCSRLKNAANILNTNNSKLYSLQGNLDPQILMADEETIRQRVRDITTEASQLKNSHIFNVGHGLMPHISPDSLTIVIDELRKQKI